MGNQYAPGLVEPRIDGSYIYDELIDVENAAEDIKVYTVVSTSTHAETRSYRLLSLPKYERIRARLSDEKVLWARKICKGFDQCMSGFIVLRRKGSDRSMMFDVSSWSFVKGQRIVPRLGIRHPRQTSSPPEHLQAINNVSPERHYLARSPATSRQRRKAATQRPRATRSGSWMLKANVTAFRHAERTPKQKLDDSFPRFIKLFNGATEEIFLRRDREQLNLIVDAIEEAKQIIPIHGSVQHAELNGHSISISAQENLVKLAHLNVTWEKIHLVGTTPAYRKFTHAARYGPETLARIFGNISLSSVHKDMLHNVETFTSSERRVTASAEIFVAALLDSNTPRNVSHVNPGSPLPLLLPHTPPSCSARSSGAGSVMDRPAVPCYNLIIRKDLLDDSNAAKELMGDVKERLEILLRNGESERRPKLTCPKNMNAIPAWVVQEAIQLMSSFRTTMRKLFETLEMDKIQERWCYVDDLFLFRERREKLLDDFCDVKEKFDPSRVGSLNQYHFLSENGIKWDFFQVSELYDALKFSALHHRTFLFAIFSGNGGTVDPNDRRLHELYGRAKGPFDLITPQEYGIEASENSSREGIGVLTSLPLLPKIAADLEAVGNLGMRGLTVYFTKLRVSLRGLQRTDLIDATQQASHIHTLVNLVLYSGLPIANPRIPELGYSSHITSELYERSNGHNKNTPFVSPSVQARILRECIAFDEERDVLKVRFFDSNVLYPALDVAMLSTSSEDGHYINTLNTIS
ncbi:hypothetical protein FS837_007932 [Tulasnella sp. UAMH 9824]|nr:hypothetical protein FS837_007932 [Tulasnella sp. UAMH 9824]